MAEVRRRTASSSTVTRRRDRAREEEPEEEEEEGPRRRSTAKTRPATTRSTTRRPARAKDEEDEEDDEEEEGEEEDEDEEERPRARRASTTTERRTAAPARSARRKDDDDEDERPKARSRTGSSTARPSSRSRRDDDEPPRRRTASATKDRHSKLKSGVSGAREMRSTNSSGVARLVPAKEQQLVLFLEDGPFVSYKQHWLPSGGAKERQQVNRPYTCLTSIGEECPICDIGDRARQVDNFNVLHFTGDNPPTVKVLSLSPTAAQTLEELATDGKGKLDYQKDFWAISKSGTGLKAQVNFRPVKERDLDDDWPEIFDQFDRDDLDDIIDEAAENMLDKSIVEIPSKRQLSEVAKYVSDDDEDDDD